MDLQIEIGRQAREEIHSVLTEDPLECAALVVQMGEDEECCGVAFEVLLVEQRNVPSEGYLIVGEQYGWPVYVSKEVAPSGASRLIINVDRASGRLAGLFMDK